MSLNQFLYDLHFDIDQVQPPDWIVDWDHAPLPYKIYMDLPTFPLSLEVPLTLIERRKAVEPTLQDLGHFLWYGYGITQYSQSFEPNFPQQIRRHVPSGGALYPNELYLYLRMDELPTGIYHYDVAHHRLVLLREGNFDDYLAQALGYRCELTACFGVVLVSVLFWKNFFKYHYFSYRLQGLDTGVLIGQLLEVSKRFGFEAGVYFQFLDRAIHHLLGLTGHEESVYALLPLSVNPNMIWFSNKDRDQERTADPLCQELPVLHHEHNFKSSKMHAFPMLTKANEAAQLETTAAFQVLTNIKPCETKAQKVPLPPVDRLSYDLAEVCRNRYSPGMDFVMQPVSLKQMAILLNDSIASFFYRNDLDEDVQNRKARVSLAGCLVNVEGIQDGAYAYDADTHALQMIRFGDYRHQLQQGMAFHNVNLFQVPMCFHVIGEQHHLQETFGYRGYRIQQMEAGMLVQRLLLTAAALEMGGHPLLGYDGNSCDELYQLKKEEKTSLIQIPIGFYRLGSRWAGSLHG